MDTKITTLDEMILRGYRGAPGTDQCKLTAGVSEATRRHERKFARLGWPPHMCCMGDHGSRSSIAFSVWCLIKDVHSPMDYYPVHAGWDVIY